MREVKPPFQPAQPKRPPFPEPVDLVPMTMGTDAPFVVRYLNCTSNKPLHLGHLRNIVLGEATVASLRAIGAHAVGHCVLEDTGRFMTEAMAALRAAGAAGEAIPSPGATSDHFIGGCYARYRAALAARNGAAAAGGKAPAAAQTEYAGRNDEADELMRALLRKEEHATKLRNRVRALATAGQHATLVRLGVGLDYCDFESAEDPLIHAFAERCEPLLTDEKGERGWHSAAGQRLRLVNKAGLYEESARLLSFNARVAERPAAAYRTIVFAGSEWRGSMRLYAEFLSALGVDVADKYLPTFYGMVTLNGKKMASSAGTGVLIDDLLDILVAHPRIRRIAENGAWGATSDQIAAAHARIFLLAAPRTEAISYSPDAIVADDNAAWRIVEAWASMPEGPGRSSAGSRAAIADAVARRSYEGLVERARGLADSLIEGPADPAADDFRGLTDALSLKRTSVLPGFLEIPSFLTALDCAAAAASPGHN